MKESIRARIVVGGYADNLCCEWVTICGARCEFCGCMGDGLGYDDALNRTALSFFACDDRGFSPSKAKYIIRKAREYMRWTARQNEKAGWDLPEIRRKWY